MSALQCIVYVSSAVRDLSGAEMAHLLGRARARNLAAEVTGILLNKELSFMQYIEGPRDALDRIYTIIQLDPQHQGLIELLHEATDIRLFPDWSMAYRTKRFESFTPPARHASPLSPEAPEEPWAAPPALAVLRQFWGSSLA